MSNWKAIYVASRSEKKVNASFIRLGIESYLPLKIERKQWSDRKKVVISPLINGYVFVKTNDQNRDIVFKVQHVIKYVRSNGVDAIIRDSEIEVLKSIEKKGYYVEGKFGRDIKEGEPTLITEGPFKGYHGIVKSKVSENIYYISIQSIDFSLTIKVPSEILEKQ